MHVVSTYISFWVSGSEMDTSMRRPFVLDFCSIAWHVFLTVPSFASRSALGLQLLAFCEKLVDHFLLCFGRLLREQNAALLACELT